MFKLLNNYSLFRFSANNQNLLKAFGIVNPNIVRNLSYFIYLLLEFLNIMKWELTLFLLMPTPDTTKSQALELSLLILELKQGNSIYLYFRRSPTAKRIVTDPIR